MPLWAHTPPLPLAKGRGRSLPLQPHWRSLGGNNNSKSRHTDAAAVPVVTTAVHLALAWACISSRPLYSPGQWTPAFSLFSWPQTPGQDSNCCSLAPGPLLCPLQPVPGCNRLGTGRVEACVCGIAGWWCSVYAVLKHTQIHSPPTVALSLNLSAHVQVTYLQGGVLAPTASTCDVSCLRISSLTTRP